MLDTHCHIDEEAFSADQEAVIARQKAEGVQAMIVPGVNVGSISSVLDVCQRHKGYCFPALGLHPEDVKDDWQTALTTIENAIRTHRNQLVAIGEIGLDYYWDTTYKEQQKEVLRRQLLLARELDLPVILHNREATEDILTIVKECAALSNQASALRGVFHCFNGSKETAQQILNMGFYLGIGGVLTFKNCKLKEMLRELPQAQVLQRLVLETDAPYMAPVPHRGERNESRFMIHIVELLSQIYQVSQTDIIETTSKNAKQLFKLEQI